MPHSPSPSPPPYADRPPASRAALLSLNATPPHLSETLHTLLRTHSNLTHSLSATAPPWPSLVPSLTSLHHALSATQLSPSPSPLTTDFPTPLSDSLILSTQLTSKLSLLASIRTFLTLASPPPHPLPLLPRARRLRDARDAAALPALVAIPALDKPRAEPIARHNSLRQELDDALRNAVFTPNRLRLQPVSDPEDDEGISLSAPSLRTPSPPLSQTPDPALVLAADTLSGPGHSARLLADAAPHSLATAIRHAVLAERPPPPPTVPSLASSSFTASAATPATASACSARPTATSTAPMHAPAAFARPIGLFARDEHNAQRAVCQAVFERVVAILTGVLRRLAALAAAVTQDATGMDRAVSEAWAVAQGLLVRFAHALLALPESSDAEDLEDDQARVVAASGLSLLPHRSGPPSASGHRGYRTYAWAFERGSAYQDSFEALVAHVTALSPSIYNLEVVYAPLQQFIGNSGRLLHAWQQPDDVASVLSGPGVEAEYAILPAFVSKAVDVFVKAARNDVRAYMGNAFGNRAGTLLQPPSLGKIREHTQVAGAASRYALPAMSQTQVLLDVIGNCLSLCIAVPTVARRLGEVVNSDVIKPFSERAIYALNLAESWTDAGPLLKEIRTAAHPTEESQKLDAHGASSSSRRNGLRRSQTWNAKALRTIRRRPDLTTTCLSRMYDKSNHLAREKPVRLLDESEWNAVVRLVVNAKVVIAELENCTNTEEEWKPTGVTSHSSSFSQESVSILKLRAALCDHGASASHQRAVIEAVGRMRSGCRILREEVVERGIAVLHTEVVLRCFWEAMQTLTINKKVKKTGLSRSAIPANDAIPHVNGTGISKVAPIFKTSNFQLSDAERSSEDTSVAMCEYDEFGDRIANENVTDVDIEDYSFPSTAVFEATEWKAPPRDSSIRSTTDDVMLSAAQTQALTDADRRIVARGRAFGEELRSKDEVIKCNLSVRERRFIFCEADGGVAAGIRVAGELAGKGDRDVASGARLFLDAAATTGAVAFGWPVVESDYSVAEGASASGSECRTLLYAAGLM